MHARDSHRRKLELSLPIYAAHQGQPYASKGCELLIDLAASLQRDLPH